MPKPSTTPGSGVLARANGTEVRVNNTSAGRGLLNQFRRACGLTAPLRLTVRGRAGDRSSESIIEGPFAFVGGGRRNDVGPPASGVNRRHAYLQVVGDRVFCLDLGSRAGIRWNGERQTAGWLDLDAEFSIGPFVLRLSTLGRELDDSDGPDDFAPGPSVLEVQRGHDSPVFWTVADGVSLLGRATPCALRAADPQLDPYHAALVRAAGQLWVVDLRSGRGTRVNGREVRFGRLRDGDILQAGDWTAVARYHADASPACPTPARLPVTSAVVPANGAVADASQAMAPFQQMMQQFQNCVSMMGQMFTAMQQQHMQLVREQMVQIRDLTRELMNRPAAVGDFPYATPDQSDIPWASDAPYNLPNASPQPDLPTPRMTSSQESHELQQAHAWFSEQLANLGQSTKR
jgi:pSer/pThr/pTyr-binding forkhead associated (FHA) protein